MSKSTKKSTKKPVVRETVSPGHLERIKRLDAEHTEYVLANRVVYPDPAEFDEIELPTLEELGFAEKVDFDLAEIEVFYGRGRRRRDRSRQRKKDRQRKNKNRKRKGGGGGRGRKLPNPNTVAAEVKAIMANIADVDNTGNIVAGSWNLEFLDASKARYFLETYKVVVPKHHIIFCSEITQAGLDVIANALGWKAFASVENNRNQAVGFLVHPRLEVIGKPISYDEVASVQGIANLRPAFRLNLKDTATGEEFAAVVNHLKSMRGGPKVTGPVRRQQCNKIAEGLGPDFVGLLGGDWNTHLDNTTDTDPLTNAGFKLVCPRDTTATQAMGSRLDGYFKKSTGVVGRMRVFNFWKNTKITRALSDHGVVRIHKRVCASGVGNDATCGTMPGADGPFSDNPKGGTEADVTP